MRHPLESTMVLILIIKKSTLWVLVLAFKTFTVKKLKYMEKIKIKIVTAVTAASIIVLSMYACNKDFLNKAPLGSLDPGNLSNSAGVQGLLIGAYSILDGYGGANSGWESAASNWVYGSVASDDSYK